MKTKLTISFFDENSTLSSENALYLDGEFRIRDLLDIINRHDSEKIRIYEIGQGILDQLQVKIEIIKHEL